MRLASIKSNGTELAAFVTGNGLVPMAIVNEAENKQWDVTLFGILQQQQFEEIMLWYNNGGEHKLQGFSAIPFSEAEYAPLYRHPRKIWGIGINYVETAEQLNDVPPDSEPVSFMKPDTSIIGFGDAIQLPVQSERPTAEAELGIIIGAACRNITEAEAKNVVAGFTTTLDMTAADIHAKNQRFLTRAKSFDTFFSFGPHLVSVDEIDDISGLTVNTVLNGKVEYYNTISNMRYSLWHLVAFHSQVMTLLPGDVIITGTPGAVVIRDGDMVECRITGFEPLVNPVAGF